MSRPDDNAIADQKGDYRHLPSLDPHTAVRSDEEEREGQPEVCEGEDVRKGITEWVPKWKADGWMTSARKPVANVDLWKALDRVAEGQRVDWRWTKGHAGDPMNDEADHLASREASRAARKLTE